jgi:hypothetical protein
LPVNANEHRRRERACGFLFLFIIATSIMSSGLGVIPETESDKTDKTLEKIADDPARYQISIVFDVLSHICIVILACALYITYSPQNRKLAIIGTALRITEGVILGANEVNNWMLLGVAQEYIGVDGDAKRYSLAADAHTIILNEGLGFRVGLTFFAMGALAYCILFVSSKAVPPALGWLGVIASVLILSGIGLGYLLPEFSIVYQLGFILMIGFEIYLGGWLMFKGSERSSPQCAQ